MVGLDMDFCGLFFGFIFGLLVVVEYIIKVYVICFYCGNLVIYFYCLFIEDLMVVLGEKDKYEFCCCSCYNMGNILDLK